ncbi:MAG: hypothetical protein ACOCV8_03915, partial [Spirochaetota bacterium]
MRLRYIVYRSLLLILLVLTSLSLYACETFFDDVEDIEIAGEWIDEGTNQYGNWKQKLEISNSKITNYFIQGIDDDNQEWDIYWEASIYDYDNRLWNGGETGSGDLGYAVIKYTTPSENQPNSESKYMVFRWQNLSKNSFGTTMEWAEGFKSDPDSEEDECGDFYCG